MNGRINKMGWKLFHTWLVLYIAVVIYGIIEVAVFSVTLRWIFVINWGFIGVFGFLLYKIWTDDENHS